MSLSEELTKSMSPYVMFHIGPIPVSDTVVTMWIVMAILIIGAWLLTRNMKQMPEGKQNVVELAVESFNNLLRENLGHHWRTFAPYLGTVIAFLLVSNIISIFNILPFKQIGEALGIESLAEYGIRPPTRDINVPACLALMTIFIVIFAGIIIKGPRKWLKGFVQPVPLMLPFNIIEYGIKPLTLCLRLFGNIIGAFIVMELLYAFFPLVLPAALSVYFDLFDGLLQAYVFVFLSTLYIAEAIE